MGEPTVKVEAAEPAAVDVVAAAEVTPKDEGKREVKKEEALVKSEDTAKPEEPATENRGPIKKEEPVATAQGTATVQEASDKQQSETTGQANKKQSESVAGKKNAISNRKFDPKVLPETDDHEKIRHQVCIWPLCDWISM